MGIYFEEFLRNARFSIIPLTTFWVLFSTEIAHSSVIEGIKIERRHFMQKIQWITLGIVKLTFLVEIWSLITPGGRLGPEKAAC